MPTPYSPFNQNVFDIKPWNSPERNPTSKKTSSSYVSKGAPSDASSTTTTSTDTKPVTVDYNPIWASRGLTKEIWDSYTPAKKATIGAGLEAGLTLVQNTGHTTTFQEALDAAKNDPDIIAKYSNGLRIDAAQLQQGLADLQTTMNVQSQTDAMKFEQDKKALSEAQAAAGTAYSGFRGKAQENLAKTEAGIVTSSRAQAQQKVRDAQQAFEAKWGTTATKTSSVDFYNPISPSALPESISGTNIGGITGSEVLGQKQDVNKLADTTYNLSAIKPVIPA